MFFEHFKSENEETKGFRRHTPKEIDLLPIDRISG